VVFHSAGKQINFLYVQQFKMGFSTAMGKLPTDVTSGMIRTVIPAAKASIGPPIGTHRNSN
jgi:hypothetical protein